LDKIARKYLPKRSPNKGILALVTMGLKQNHYLIPYPNYATPKITPKKKPARIYKTPESPTALYFFIGMST